MCDKQRMQKSPGYQKKGSRKKKNDQKKGGVRQRRGKSSLSLFTQGNSRGGGKWVDRSNDSHKKRREKKETRLPRKNNDTLSKAENGHQKNELPGEGRGGENTL